MSSAAEQTPVVYVAERPPPNAQPPKEFAERKLNLFPTPIQLIWMTLSWTVAPAWHLFRASIAYMVDACEAVKEVVFAVQEGLDVTGRRFPIPDFLYAPGVGITIAKAMASSKPEILDALQGRFANRLDFMGMQTFLVKHFDLDDLSTCLQHGVPLDGPAPNNYINISGWQSTQMLHRIIYAVLSTQLAFGESLEELFDYDAGSTDSISVHGRKQSRDGLQVPWYGPASAAPARSSALFFPWFPSMLIFQDADVYVLRIIQDHFMTLLGRTSAEQHDTMLLFSKGWSSYKNVIHGEVLAHICLALDLYMKTGCQVYLVAEGREYLGFITYGISQLRIQSRKYLAVGARDIPAHLSVFASREGLKQVIADALSAIEFPDGSLKTVTLEMIDTDWSIMHLLMSRSPIKPSETVTRLQSALDRYSIGKTFLAPNFENLSNMFRYLAGENPALYSIGVALDFTSILSLSIIDRSVLAFAVFGDSAPRFWMPGPATREVSVATGIIVNKPGSKDGKVPAKDVSLFPVYHGTVPQAVQDWRTVLTGGKVRFPVGKKSKAPVLSKSQFNMDKAKDLWKFFDSAVSKGSTISEKKAGKRKMEMSGDEKEEAERLIKRLRELQGLNEDEEMEL